MPIERSNSDLLELSELLAAYTKLQSQCFHVLSRRGVSEKELTRIMENAADHALDWLDDPNKSERSAYSWLRFIVGESLDPVYSNDAAAELNRLKRYLLTASLVCTEAGDLPDD